MRKEEGTQFLFAGLILLLILFYSYYMRQDYIRKIQQELQEDYNYNFPPELSKYNYSIYIINISGIYYPKDYTIKKDTILVYSGRNTIIHEISHRIWYEYMNQSLKDEWRQLPNITITDYSYTIEEDFATVFECYYGTNVIIIKNNKTTIYDDCKNYLKKEAIARFEFFEKYHKTWENEK